MNFLPFKVLKCRNGLVVEWALTFLIYRLHYVGSGVDNLSDWRALDVAYYGPSDEAIPFFWKSYMRKDNFGPLMAVYRE